MGSRFLAPALLALAGSAAWAQAPAVSDFSWGASASALHRRLEERADDGSRLVRESGPMLRLALDAQLRLANGGALRADAGIAGARLDYDGQTQTGVALSTTTRHRDLDAGIAWRPLSAASWGEAWLVLRAVQQRRTIEGTAIAGGLQETSTYWMPGVRWTHAFAAGGWNWQPAVELRVSAGHDLDIDYRGVFDPSDLKGGRRRDLLLGLEASAPGSPWQWGVEWTHTRQSASAQQPIYRAGAAVGLVRQPRIRIDDLSVRVRRTF
ncbi:MAG TPA: hypothetical protein VNB23_11930 [Ramlibacter sp.]|nr:hypothetical protein [Ramlibacter sp.]